MRALYKGILILTFSKISAALPGKELSIEPTILDDFILQADVNLFLS